MTTKRAHGNAPLYTSSLFYQAANLASTDYEKAFIGSAKRNSKQEEFDLEIFWSLEKKNSLKEESESKQFQNMVYIYIEEDVTELLPLSAHPLFEQYTEAYHTESFYRDDKGREETITRKK